MKCPSCDGECERDMVDVGVGEIPCGPWGCPICHWVEGRDDPSMIVAGYPCPSEECPFCSGEMCWTHDRGCDCDVIDRHKNAPIGERS